jgi:hypothetical protein
LTQIVCSLIFIDLREIKKTELWSIVFPWVVLPRFHKNVLDGMYKYFCLIEHVFFSCSFIEVHFHCFKNEAFAVASRYEWYLNDVFIHVMSLFWIFFPKVPCRFLYKNDIEIATGYVDITLLPFDSSTVKLLISRN